MDVTIGFARHQKIESFPEYSRIHHHETILSASCQVLTALKSLDELSRLLFE